MSETVDLKHLSVFMSVNGHLKVGDLYSKEVILQVASSLSNSKKGVL